MEKLRHSFENVGRKLTIQQRIAFLNAGSILILGIILVLFINLAASLFFSSEIGLPNTMVLTKATDAAGYPVTIIEETPGPEGSTIQRYAATFPGDPLNVVKFLSVVGVILIGAIGFFASQWIARKSLQPVNTISQAARSINIRSLEQRLNYQGAQDEVKILADAFDAMLERLELYFKDQSEFISNLTHEIRTPLTSLRINIEDLASDPQAAPEDYQVFLERAERALTRLDRLVEDMLLLAKGEKEIDQQPVVLGVLFEEVLDELRPVAEQRSISLKMSGDIELVVSGDPVLLQRTFSNLIENGIYYNQAGGFVEISAKRENDRAIIEVQDNGMGVSSQQQVHLFERFYRARESAGSNQNGKGLGLAITAHIVYLHNGQISVSSIPGQGSTFRIEIPLPHPKLTSKIQKAHS